MKRRIWLSLLLCLLLIPGATIFTACGDDEGYQLSELRTDFNEIVTKYDNVNLTSDNRIEFDYSIYTHQNEQYFTDLVNSSRPYSHLNNFIIDCWTIHCNLYITTLIDVPLTNWTLNERREIKCNFIFSHLIRH